MRSRGPLRGVTAFTLVELVLVVLILGILSVTMMPHFADPGVFHSRTMADELRATLRLARNAAITRGCAVLVRTGEHGFSVWNDGACTDASAVAPRFDLPMHDAFGDAVIAREDVALPPREMVFGRDGRVQVEPASTDPVTLDVGGHTVTLYQETGLVQ